MLRFASVLCAVLTDLNKFCDLHKLSDDQLRQTFWRGPSSVTHTNKYTNTHTPAHTHKLTHLLRVIITHLSLIKFPTFVLLSRDLDFVIDIVVVVVVVYIISLILLNLFVVFVAVVAVSCGFPSY